MSLREVVQWLDDHGCVFDRFGAGSHLIYRRPDGGIVTVPRKNDNPIGTLKAIEKLVLASIAPPPSEEAEESSLYDAPGKDETGGYRGKWLTAQHCPLKMGDRLLVQVKKEESFSTEFQATVINIEPGTPDSTPRFLDVQVNRKQADLIKQSGAIQVSQEEDVWRIPVGGEAVRVKTAQKGLCPSFVQAQAHGGVTDGAKVRGVSVRHALAEERNGEQLLKVTVDSRKDAESLSRWRQGCSVSNSHVHIFYVKFSDAQLRVEGSVPPGTVARTTRKPKSDGDKSPPDTKHIQPSREKDENAPLKPAGISPPLTAVKSQPLAEPTLAAPLAKAPAALKDDLVRAALAGKIPDKATLHLRVEFDTYVICQMLGKRGHGNFALKTRTPVLDIFFEKGKAEGGGYVYRLPYLGFPASASSVKFLPTQPADFDKVFGDTTVLVNDIPARWIAFDAKKSHFSVLAPHGSLDGHKPAAVARKGESDVYHFSTGSAAVTTAVFSIELPQLATIDRYGIIVDKNMRSGILLSDPGCAPTIIATKTEIPEWHRQGIGHQELEDGRHKYIHPVVCPDGMGPSDLGTDPPPEKTALLTRYAQILVGSTKMLWASVDPSDGKYHKFHKAKTIPELFKDQAQLKPGDLSSSRLICALMARDNYQKLKLEPGLSVVAEENINPVDSSMSNVMLFIRRDKVRFRIPTWSIDFQRMRDDKSLANSRDSYGMVWRAVKPQDLPKLASLKGDTTGDSDVIEFEVREQDLITINGQKALMFRAGHEQIDEVGVLRMEAGDLPQIRYQPVSLRTRGSKSRSVNAGTKLLSFTLVSHPEKPHHYLMANLTASRWIDRGLKVSPSDLDLRASDVDAIIETCKLSELVVGEKGNFLWVHRGAHQSVPTAASGSAGSLQLTPAAKAGSTTVASTTATTSTTSTSSSSTLSTDFKGRPSYPPTRTSVAELAKRGVAYETPLRIGPDNVEAWFEDYAEAASNSIWVLAKPEAGIGFAEKTEEREAIVSHNSIKRRKYARHLIDLDKCDVRLA